MIGAVNDASEWLTWPQAADLVGCSIPTVETYVRTGRIESRRGQQGGHRGGSLRRTSVEAFAVWWREETARRDETHRVRDQRKAAKDARRIRPPEPEGWIQATEAAELLGHPQSAHVIYLAQQGKFEARKVSTRWWVRRADVEAYAAERDQWVSWLKAAEIIGCSHETIRRAVAAGQIEKRDVHRTQASLSRASVLAFAETWRTTRVSEGPPSVAP